MRLIDAEKLLLEVEKSMDNNAHTDNNIKQNHHYEHIHFLTMIHKQPTVDEWISTTERMPDEAEKYRDIIDYSTLAVTDVEYYNASELVIVTVRNNSNDEIFVSCDNTVNGKWGIYNGIYNEYEVIAWKPTPKPYVK